MKKQRNSTTRDLHAPQAKNPTTPSTFTSNVTIKRTMYYLYHEKAYKNINITIKYKTVRHSYHLEKIDVTVHYRISGEL